MAHPGYKYNILLKRIYANVKVIIIFNASAAVVIFKDMNFFKRAVFCIWNTVAYSILVYLSCALLTIYCRYKSVGVIQRQQRVRRERKYFIVNPQKDVFHHSEVDRERARTKSM